MNYFEQQIFLLVEDNESDVLLMKEAFFKADIPNPLQIVDEQIPMTEHDIPLNAIVTPAELIEIKPRFSRPKGIYWKMLPPEKIEEIPALAKRRDRPPGKR